MTFIPEHNINAWKSIEFTSTAVNLVYLQGKPNISREEATEGSLWNFNSVYQIFRDIFGIYALLRCPSVQ